MKGYFKCRNCRHRLDLSTDSVCTNHNIVLNDLDSLNVGPDHTDLPAHSAEQQADKQQTNGQRGSAQQGGEQQTCEDNHYFLIDSKLNQFAWIVEQLDKANWTRGKINCPNKCGAKIGTFNFVNCLKCSCGKETVPSVQIVRSRVDFHT